MLQNGHHTSLNSEDDFEYKCSLLFVRLYTLDHKIESPENMKSSLDVLHGLSALQVSSEDSGT